MKFFVRFVCAALIIGFFISIFSPGRVVYADNNFSVSVSSNTVNVDDLVYVYCTCNSSDIITNFSGELSFDNEAFSYVSGGVGISNDAVRLQSEGGTYSCTFTVAFVATKPAVCEFVFSGNVIKNADAKFDRVTTEVTVNKAPKTENNYSSSGGKQYLSSNIALTDLKVSCANLVPLFDKNVFNYTAIVKYGVNKVTITATSNDGKITGDGTFDIKVGDNKRPITVTSRDGKTKKTYNVNIHRMTKKETAAFEAAERNENPLSVNISGEGYSLLPDLTNKGIFENYIVKNAIRKDVNVTYLSDTNGKYNLYLAENASGKERYINQTELGNFEEIGYIIKDNKIYIANEIPDNIDYSEDYIKTTLKIDGINIPALQFKQSGAKDMFILYCYNGEELEYYRYDKTEKTLSRAPEFAMKYYSLEGNIKDKGIIARFNALSKAAKLVVVLIALSVVFIVALISFSVYKKIKQKGKENESLENDLSDVEIAEETDEEITDNF